MAVVAPSGPIPEERLAAGLDVLRGWGLDPVAAPHVLDRHGELGYLAGADADRAADLQRAWCDPAVDAVICARGGYGAQRMADALDWEAMRAAGPKVFVGFSDITTLHEAFAVRLGLVTLHGPMAAGADFVKSARAQEHLRATLFDPESVRTIRSDGTALVPGRARPRVTLGGCLSLIARRHRHPAHPRLRARRTAVPGGRGEETYRLDRYLTQLLRAGMLDGVVGLLLGSWAECDPYDTVRTLLVDRLGGLGCRWPSSSASATATTRSRCRSASRPNWTRTRAR